MLSKEKIRQLFHKLNEKLRKKDEVGEIGIVGGAAMSLVFNARQSTRDVDAIFKPAELIRKLAAEVATEEGIDPDWLNDGAKGYLVDGFTRNEVLNLSHLRVWSPDPKYMLAMKCLAARWDSMDRTDVIFLLKLLNLTKPKQVYAILEGYYPKNRIPAKTQFFIEEILQEKKKTKTSSPRIKTS